VTIMRVDEELDHGPALSVATLEIGPDERTPSLARRLAELGAGAIIPVLSDIERGTSSEVQQNHAHATLAPKIAKQEGAIRWNESAAAIYNRFRAFDPWPGVFFDWHGEMIKVTSIASAGLEASQPAGTILSLDVAGVTIATAGGAIRILELQRAGKARAAAADVARGLGWRAGERLQ
jgi:methionyl-tRNA formyltransferase